MEYTYNKENMQELLEQLKEDDTVTIKGADLLELIRKASTEGKGRKPITVDSELFETVVARWEAGKITAKAAMQELNLKPNTFYRRIHERVASGELKADVKELKQKVHADAQSAKAAIDEKKQQLEMEREIHGEKLSAELHHIEEMRSLKDEVAKEAQNFKNSTKE